MSQSRSIAASPVTLTAREQSHYSLARAILAAASDGEGGVYHSHCFEMEVSREIEKGLPASTKRHGGIFVPYSLAIDPAALRRAEARYRAGLDSKTTNQGKEFVFTQAGSLIEYLYQKMVVKQLGTETLEGLEGNVAFPKQTGKVTGAWVSENPYDSIAVVLQANYVAKTAGYCSAPDGQAMPKGDFGQHR